MVSVARPGNSGITGSSAAFNPGMLVRGRQLELFQKSGTLTTVEAAVAKNGDRIVIVPGQYFDCAVWNPDNLVIESTGPGVVITDKACMGKGFLVIEGKNTTVRNLTLTRSRVPDMNGAGIRLDNGNLTVDNVKFIGNQNGIFGGVPGTTITIRNSDFDKNGTCEAACAHGI